MEETKEIMRRTSAKFNKALWSKATGHIFRMKGRHDQTNNDTTELSHIGQQYKGSLEVERERDILELPGTANEMEIHKLCSTEGSQID